MASLYNLLQFIEIRFSKIASVRLDEAEASSIADFHGFKHVCEGERFNSHREMKIFPGNG